MKLNKVNGNTYKINNPTNIGVYAFKSKYCLLVDTGINNAVAGKINGLLEVAGYKPKYIVNTHNHPDHSGGNSYFKEHYPGTVFYASAGEKIFIENLVLFPVVLYGALPVKEMGRKLKGCGVDVTLPSGTVRIGEEKFEVIPLKGHSLDQIGIATPDRVCFLGDSLFSYSIMEKYPFPFLYDIEEQLKTIEYIKSLDYDYYVLSHGDTILDAREVVHLADRNRDNIEKYCDCIKDMLNQPLTREEILEKICIDKSMRLDFRSYYLCLSTVGAFISYLSNMDLLEHQVENGRLYYYLK